MLPRFSPHGEPSCPIRSRVQAALHGFANPDVLIIHPLADGDTLPVALGGGVALVIEVEIEDHGAAINAFGQHKVRVHVTLVEIDHEVGILPEVPGAVAGTGGGSG